MGRALANTNVPDSSNLVVYKRQVRCDSGTSPESIGGGSWGEEYPEIRFDPLNFLPYSRPNTSLTNSNLEPLLKSPNLATNLNRRYVCQGPVRDGALAAAVEPVLDARA